MKKLEKPVRKWLKQKDYNRHKAMRKIQKKRKYNRQRMAEGKLPKLDDGVTPNVFQDAVTGGYYYNDGSGRIDLEPLNKLTEDPATWTYTDASGRVYNPQMGLIDTGSIQQAEEPSTFEKLMRSNKYTEREFDDWKNNKSAIKALYDNFGIMSAPIRALQGGNALLSDDGLAKTYNMFKNATLDRPDLFWGGVLSGTKDIMDLGLLAEGTYSTNKMFQNRANRQLIVPQNNKRSGDIELTEDDFPMMNDFQYSDANQNQKLITKKSILLAPPSKQTVPQQNQMLQLADNSIHPKLLPPPLLSERDKMHLEAQPFMDEVFSGNPSDFRRYFGVYPSEYIYDQERAFLTRILENEYRAEYPETASMPFTYSWTNQPDENLARHHFWLSELKSNDLTSHGISSRMYEDFRARGLSRREALDEIQNIITNQNSRHYVPDFHLAFERFNQQNNTNINQQAAPIILNSAISGPSQVGSTANTNTATNNITTPQHAIRPRAYRSNITSATYFQTNNAEGRAAALKKTNDDFNSLKIGGKWDLTHDRDLSTDSYSLELGVFARAQEKGLADIGVVKNADGSVKMITLNALGRFTKNPAVALRRINTKIDKLNRDYNLNLPRATYENRTYKVPAINATKLKDGTLIERIIKSKK